MRKMLTGTLATVITSWMEQHTQLALRQMTQNFLNSLMAIWKTLVRSASQVYASASRSFQEARELLSRLESARGYFPVVGSGAFNGLAQPSTDRKPAKSRDNSKKGKRKGKSSSQKGGQSPNLGTSGILPKPQTSRFESRPPMSNKRPTEVGATRGGPHHAPRLRPDQCTLCRQVGHRASECPTKEKRLHFHLAQGHLVHMLWVVQCSMPRVMVQLSKKPNKIKTRMTSKTLLRFSIKTLEGFAILDGGATKTVSGFMSSQTAADQYEGHHD